MIQYLSWYRKLPQMLYLKTTIIIYYLRITLWVRNSERAHLGWLSCPWSFQISAEDSTQGGWNHLKVYGGLQDSLTKVFMTMAGHEGIRSCFLSVWVSTCCLLRAAAHPHDMASCFVSISTIVSPSLDAISKNNMMRIITFLHFLIPVR